MAGLAIVASTYVICGECLRDMSSVASAYVTVRHLWLFRYRDDYVRHIYFIVDILRMCQPR